jgi:hypothetical protein
VTTGIARTPQACQSSLEQCNAKLLYHTGNMKAEMEATFMYFNKLYFTSNTFGV